MIFKYEDKAGDFFFFNPLKRPTTDNKPTCFSVSKDFLIFYITFLSLAHLTEGVNIKYNVSVKRWTSSAGTPMSSGAEQQHQEVGLEIRKYWEMRSFPLTVSFVVCVVNISSSRVVNVRSNRNKLQCHTWAFHSKHSICSVDHRRGLWYRMKDVYQALDTQTCVCWISSTSQVSSSAVLN